MSKGNPDILQLIFSKFDMKNRGVLSVGNFKNCFLQSGLNFQMTDITRLARYLPKEKDDMINYAKFLKQIDDVFFEKNKLDDLSKFAQLISEHLRSHNLTLLKFIKNISLSGDHT